MKEFGLQKQERLSSKKVIDRLFSEGNTFFMYPFKVVFLTTDLPVTMPAQAAFSVSKKNFKRAVRRNQIKRRMREIYRLHKAILYEVLEDKQLAVMFIYTGKQIEEFETMERGLLRALNKLSKLMKKGLPSAEEKPSTHS